MRRFRPQRAVGIQPARHVSRASRVPLARKRPVRQALTRKSNPGSIGAIDHRVFRERRPNKLLHWRLPFRTVSQDETARIEVNPIATARLAPRERPHQRSVLPIRTILYAQAFGRALMLQHLALPGLDAAAVALRGTPSTRKSVSKISFLGRIL